MRLKPVSSALLFAAILLFLLPQAKAEDFSGKNWQKSNLWPDPINRLTTSLYEPFAFTNREKELSR